MNLDWKDGLTRFIAANVMVFVMLFLPGAGGLVKYLGMPLGWGPWLHKPWTVFTYAFVHQGFWHLLWNMVLLYWSANSLTDLLGKRVLYPLFLAGGLAGALFYQIGLGLTLGWDHAGTGGTSYLIGSSASVMAVFWALVLLTPDQRLLLFGIIPLQLRWLAAGFVLYDVVGLLGSNSGGHWAHLGGALAGIVYLRFKQGRLILPWESQRKARWKPSQRIPKLDVQGETDRLLDKISRSGYASLKPSEKEWLDRQNQA
jgi:membrane associated rhomboid family serine protease